ncbi:MAG: endolytic transglycosylase MltG [Patescibacteria group bacterium]
MAEEQLLRRLVKFYPWFVIILVVVIIFIYSCFQFFVPIYIPSPGKEIYIPTKTSLREIGNILEKENIINSAYYFRVYLELTNQAHKIKPGLYKFDGAIDISKLAQMMTKGGKGITITIPEGLAMIEIQDILKKNGLNVDLLKLTLADFSNSELLKYFSGESNLEGFLAPDTYEFFSEESEQEIVKKLLKNFSKKLLPEFIGYSIPKSNQARTEQLYNKLILASILEREVKKFDDMKIVAGILEKRIKNGKRLEVDATVAYIKCKSFPCEWNVTSNEVRTNSSYNTYLNNGYPPAPINNPGLNSIKAALNPLESSFWYYLTNSDSETIFSKTFSEHRTNIRKHLR